MALNPNYVPLTPLWEVFTDKDLLTFLSDGYVLFYVDTARTVGKPVYQLTGSPPNYTYTQYGFLDINGAWRVNMNLQGAFDQVIYGYPLDMDGNVQLYFADFFNVDGVFQFSREGFPNFFANGGTTGTQVDINYIPDGQFRLHTDIPATATLEVGEVRDPITNVAFGGWTFERPSGSTARDFVTFQRIGSFVTNPITSPRYAIEVTCQAPSFGDTFKDLRVKFDDVNKFASDTDMFTFGITGKVVSSGSVNVELIIIKNFGTGGSPTTETDLTTFTITNTFTPFSFAFVFGDNTGKIIGPNNDDFVQIALRYPANELFDVEFTDALLTPGNILNPVFNYTTTREFLYESLFDDTDCPAFDGSDIALPLVLTKTGLRFDDSQVGMIFAYGSYQLPFGYLAGDGANYDSTLHSSDGIPYSRLRDKYILNLTTPTYSLDFSIPIFGTGDNFLTMSPDALLSIVVSTNIAGATSLPTDGAVPTGFTFSSTHTGQTNIDASAGITSGSLYIFSDAIGVVTTPSIGTISGSISLDINGTDARSVITLIITSVVAGQYFVFYTTTASYLVWYKVNGAGTMPVVPGTIPIEIDVIGGILPQDVMMITADAINGAQVSRITTTAAATIPQSAYFNMATLTQSYYVWYNTGGAGTDPMVAGKIGIEVDIETTDTKDMVTTKTISAINLRYFATPDIRGTFLKGYSGTSMFDIGAAARYATNSVVYGNQIGTREYSNNISHNHDQLIREAPPFSFAPGTSGDASVDVYDATVSTNNVYTNIPPVAVPPAETRTLINYQGSSESRPENIYVNYIVKY